MVQSTKLLSKIGNPIKKSEIKQLLSPTWSVNHILHNSSKSANINEVTVQKMIKLAGLNENEDVEHYQKSLYKQLSVVNALYDINDVKYHGTLGKHKNSTLFRLLKSDYRPDEPLTLEQINQQIENLQPSEQKGEINFKKNDYFVINT